MNKNLLILFYIFVFSSLCAGYACYYEFTHTYIATPFPDLVDFIRQIISDIVLALCIAFTILIYRQYKYSHF